MQKLNIIIPMSGEGSRFKKMGFKEPKPMIPIFNETMVEKVVKNLLIPNRELHFYFIVRQEHVEDYHIDRVFDSLANRYNFKYTIEVLNKLTEGSLCSILKVRRFINNDENLLIANVDQWLNWSSLNFINLIDETDCEGAIITSLSDNNKWSFCRVNYNTGWITEVKEKEVISNIANVGIFYFKKGKDFLEASDDTIHRDLRVLNEYYVSIVFNYLINSLGQKILNYPISNNAFFGLGTPEDLARYIDYYKDRNEQK